MDGLALLLPAPDGAWFRIVDDAPALRRVVAALHAAAPAGPGAIRPILAAGETAAAAALLAGLPALPPLAAPAPGRCAALRAGLAATGTVPDRVWLVEAGAALVLPAPDLFAALAAALAEGAAAVLPPAPLPQLFRGAALAAALAAPPGADDDPAALLRATGAAVAALAWRAAPAPPARALSPRVGLGFDVHRLVAGRPLILCGVAVPHPLGLDGHSDADVGLHALCDAIYGALAEGDIGRWFPPTEPRWRGADSAAFLRHAAGRVAARGGRIAQLDITLICERPKIAPHADAMRARIAALAAIAPERVAVKATTTERLGFAGRGEGIAAQAAATLLLPDDAATMSG